MRAFLRVWAGQVLSSLGSGLTGFSLGIWVFQSTQSASLYALASLCVVIPGVLVSPVAGVLVDRWDRRRVMLLSDAGGMACSLMVAWLVMAGHATVWSVCALVAINSGFDALRVPAWTASVSQLVPAEQFGRASGLMQSSRALTTLVSPMLAGFLVVSIGQFWVLLIDAATFAVSIATLLSVRFPPMAARGGERARQGSFAGEVLGGLSYVRGRAGLSGLLIFSLALNFGVGLAQVSFAPLVLSQASAEVLGAITSAGGLGMLTGSVLMGAWGGPRRRVAGFLGFSVLLGMGAMVFGLLPVGVDLAGAAFFLFLCIPLVTGCSQVLWQRKVTPELQGRVFALRNMVALGSSPVAYMVAGTLVDRVLEPLMAPNGRLAGTVGRVLGVGKGRGTALLFVIAGLLVVVSAVVAYASPRIRRIEDELADVGTLDEKVVAPAVAPDS